jgi:hypothetical protein
VAVRLLCAEGQFWRKNLLNWRMEMKAENQGKLNRRDLLTKTAPACAMACLGLTKVPGLFAGTTDTLTQEVHKFDVTQEVELSGRRSIQMRRDEFFQLIRNVRSEMGDDALIRLLKVHSAAKGRQAGESLAARSPDTSFETWAATFRPPNYANRLTHEIVVDTDTVFEWRVTECIWAEIHREAGLDGEIGHAAICNMDYYWPTAFNPNIIMERDRTLMQGHDHCNHRYVDTGGGVGEGRGDEVV